MKMITKFRQWLRSPHLGYGLVISFVVGGFAGIIFWGGFNTAMEYTNNLEFCISCHVMRDTVYPEYKDSIHYSNPQGVRAVCADCHVPKDWMHKLPRKIMASFEIYHWIVGSIDTPEKFQAKRLELAQDVWKTMQASNSRECRNCHTVEAMRFDQQPEAAHRMKAGLEGGDTCIDCHKGIAHTRPDMSPIAEAAFGKLQARVDAVDLGSKTLYPVETKPFFLAPGPTGGAGGKLLVASELAVLERQGDMLKVRFGGWQQQDVASIVDAMVGRHIAVATLDAKAQETVEKQETIVEPETKTTWHKVSLTAWISKDKLVSARDNLWAYASQLYYANCSICHKLPNTDKYTANEWIDKLKAMKDNTNLNEEQVGLLQTYLQLHARDTAGAGGH
jgi:trimethylamine-N-oxide reductase cytochrome c-type subunit TorC